MSTQNSSSRSNLNNLFESRKRKSELSPDGRSMLKQSVFRLLSYHQDKDQIFQETISSTESSDPELKLQTTEHAQCLSVLERKDENDLYSSVLSIIKLINQNIELKTTILLTGKIKDEVENGIKLIKEIISSGNLQPSQILAIFNKQKFPVEVWWMLNKNNIYTIENYLNRCDELAGSQLSEELFRLLTGESDTVESRHQILSDFIDVLVQIAFPEKKNEQYATQRKLSMKILDGVTKGVLCQMKDYTEGTILHTTPPTDVCKLSYYRKYATHSLSFTMSYSPNMKVSQALQNQNNWKSAKINPVHIQLYKQLMLVFEAREVIEILNRILERQEVNWQNVLSFLATFLVCFKEAQSVIEEHVKRLLTEGLEKADMEKTIVGFLLVRQSCLEGPHVFPSYQDWFQQTFGDSGKTVAETKKSFSFLVKFLTDIVPYESAVYLKAHVLKPPYTPIKCRDLLSDYILLAKTRLADLKQPIGSEVKYDESGHVFTARKKEELAEQDVVKALNSFQTTGKIPATVMEASIFRKPYFVGQFLPALLKPRTLPDVADNRMKFIKILRKADKISNNLYTQYETNCKIETQKLLQSVFSVNESDDNGIDDVLLPPLDQLKYRLNQLKDTLENKTQTQVNEILSQISEKVEVVLNVDKNHSEDSLDDVAIVTIDTINPDLNPLHLDVIDMILNFVCKMVYSDIQCNRQSNWLKGLTAILSQRQSLVKTLFTRILVLLTNTDSNLQDHHIQGLASLTCRMICKDSVFSSILVKDCSCIKPPADILAIVLQRMESSISPGILFRFLSCYLQFGFHNTCYVSSCNKKLLKSYILLCWRYNKNYDKTRTSNNEDSDINKTIYNSPTFTDLIKDIQITFKDWLEFESSVFNHDNLSEFERYEYHSDIIHRHFLLQNDTETLASHLLQHCLFLQDSGGYICEICSRRSVMNSVTEWSNLLQMLIPLLPSLVDDNEPWVIRQYKIYTGDSSSDTLSYRTMAFFRLMIKFPSHLLFVNHAYNVTPTLVSTTFDFLKNQVKDHLTEGFYFTLPFTAYILQGLISVSQFLKDRKILQQLTSQNIFLVSIVVHWKHVQHLWSWLDLPVTKVSSCNIALETRLFIEENGFLTIPSKSDICTVACLFSILMERYSMSDETITKQIIPTLQKETAVMLLDMLLCYHAANNILQTKNWNNKCWKMINSILCNLPPLFPLLFTDAIIRQFLASFDARRYYDFTILRRLSEFSDENLKHFLKEKMNCAHMIGCFSKVTEQFDQNTVERQPVHEVLDLCKFIKKCVKMSPRSNLHFIDKNMVKNCGVDVYQLYISLCTE